MGETTGKRALPFKATREHHGLEAAEDYTELVLDLEQSKGAARTGDIAESLGISHVTALRTVRRLQEEGYLETSRGKPVTLTAEGRRLALYAKKRHQTLVEFLMAIGVPQKLAEIDVEGAEHHISKVTLTKVMEFLEERR
jgi:DtxR family manganese transport transcriptional regulator